MLVAERLWGKVDVRGPDECWPWTGRPNSGGYGEIREGGRGSKLIRSHRLAYEQLVGPIPSGAVLDHTCHNDSGCTDVPCAHRLCCNPAHLEPVTQAINSQRGRTADHNRLKTHCINNHEYTPENTIHPLRPNGRRDERVCRTCRRDAQRRYNLKREKKR